MGGSIRHLSSLISQVDAGTRLLMMAGLMIMITTVETTG